ncbi:MAG: class I SAM-dependent methyltransferase, partial [Gammaproteobacteria bacterium]|nr:class I SAM-dependent methyltransferase [Gammaproteobacteria bacterium]
VLDVASGAGRHSLHFARLGYAVTAADIDVDNVRGRAAEERGASPMTVVEADLENAAWPFAPESFDGIVVVNYLHRPHFPLLIDALAQSGVLLFDTFATGNERFGRPRNPDYLLRPGELLREFGSILAIVAYEHGLVGDAVRQRLCAVRR